ncbi:MAG: hypothetical protein RIB64_04550 [Arenibacter algicola]
MIYYSKQMGLFYSNSKTKTPSECVNPMCIYTYTHIFIFTYFNISESSIPFIIYSLEGLIVQVQPGGYGTFQRLKINVVREKKGKRFFTACAFQRPRRSGKTGTERLPKRTSLASPLGEDWSGRVARLPQGLEI